MFIGGVPVRSGDTPCAPSRRSGYADLRDRGQSVKIIDRTG
jgi:hypothetical protein